MGGPSWLWPHECLAGVVALSTDPHRAKEGRDRLGEIRGSFQKHALLWGFASISYFLVFL